MESSLQIRTCVVSGLRPKLLKVAVSMEMSLGPVVLISSSGGCSEFSLLGFLPKAWVKGQVKQHLHLPIREMCSTPQPPF